MNDADIKKVHTALKGIASIDGEVSNFLSRSARARANWTAWGKGDAAPTNGQAKLNLKRAMEAIDKMNKLAPTVRKDVTKAGAAAAPKNLAKTSKSPKEYRDKVLTVQLASLKKWYDYANVFVTAIQNSIDLELTGGIIQFPYPSQKPIDEQVTYDSARNYRKAWEGLQADLKKLA